MEKQTETFTKQKVMSQCKQFIGDKIDQIFMHDKWKWLYITAKWNGMSGQSLHGINFIGYQIRMEETSAFRKPTDNRKNYSIEKFRKRIYYIYPDGKTLHKKLEDVIVEAVKLKRDNLSQTVEGSVQASMLMQEVMIVPLGRIS